MPEKLYLDRKYNIKMMANAEIAKEAENISHHRKQYHKWLDRENNSPLKSPNYQKVQIMIFR